MNKQVHEWLGHSDYDLETAEAMFQSQRNVYAVFMCHLALEKALKAYWINTTGKIAPKTLGIQHTERVPSIFGRN